MHPFKFLALYRFAFMAATLLITSHIVAQKLPAGPQVLTFFSDLDDTEQPYGLYIPKNYDPQKKYPLVIMLHGAGSNHRLALRRVFGKSNANGENDVEASLYFPEWKDIDFIVASPYARGTAGYQGIAEKDVYDVLADVKKRFNIDEDRTYLTGLSMGGGGTLWIGLTRPDIWAAMAPVCAAAPNGTEAYAPNALNIPMHFFHGDKDGAVPVERSREWVKNLKDLGTQVEYNEYPGVNHNSWENAYADEFIFSWFSQFKRNPYPSRVRFTSDQYKYNKAYWVTIDELTPGTHASIDASFTGSNQLVITTSELGAFTLNLSGHAQFSVGQPLQITLDGKKIKVPTTASLSFVKRDGKWVAGKYEASANAKKVGAEGPIREAFATRHIYVYGTADNPNAEELKQRMDLAYEAANWSSYRGPFLGRIMFFPRIVADKDVRPSDLESCNLILFGTKETNSLISKYSDRLPMSLNPSATDYGLCYIFPFNNRYVVISSGLPWWTGAEVQGYRFVNDAQGTLTTMKDFILFKTSAKTPVAEGYFDKNWKAPAADWQKIEATGVITSN